MQLLIDGENAFPKMKQLILNAKEFLYLSFWRVDVKKQLCDKAGEE